MPTFVEKLDGFLLPTGSQLANILSSKVTVTTPILSSLIFQMTDINILLFSQVFFPCPHQKVLHLSR